MAVHVLVTGMINQCPEIVHLNFLCYVVVLLGDCWRTAVYAFEDEWVNLLVGFLTDVYSYREE